MLQDITNRLNKFLGGGQGGTVLGNGYTDKINYVDPLIANTAYDIAKGGEQYEAAPEGLVWDANRGHYVKQGSHTGLLGGALGILDWANQNYSDWDRAGTGKDKYGNLPEEGTLGGQRVQINPQINNPNFDAAKARAFQLQQQTGAVPAVNNLGTFANQFAQDAYTGWRDQRRMAGNLDMYGNALKDATLFGYGVDKASMLDAMNTPYWIAKTQGQLADAFATAKDAGSRRKLAVSDQMKTAKIQPGLVRSYFQNT
jgi:hypothetical protein